MADFKMPTEAEISAFHEKAQEVFRQSENGPPMPESLQKKMDDQALTNAALRDKNSKASKVHQEIMSMPEDEFYAKYGYLFKGDEVGEDAA